MDEKTNIPAEKSEASLNPCTLKEYTFYFLRLGALGFGGPIALAGYMQKDLVEERRWISKKDYLDGLALAQLAPGPLAAQLAIYLGWVRAGVLGATLIGLAFVIPSFFMVVGISIIYVHYGGLPWMQGVFYGIGAAVIAIIARSAYKLTKLTLAKNVVLWIVFAINAVITGWTESEIVWVFALSGILVLLSRRTGTWFKAATPPAMVTLPLWLVSGIAGPASASTLWQITWYFTAAGAFVFGSGLAIVPFLYGGVVENFHWLNERQFLDAVAVAMITPGPVVITVAFIGYLVAGFAGALLAALGTFVPCYLFTVIPAPYFRRFADNKSLRGFVDGVTAAATGAIAGAAFVLGKRAIVDLPTALIGLATLSLLLWTKKIPEPLVILAAGLIGLLVR